MKGCQDLDLPDDASAADLGVVEGGLRDDERGWFEEQRSALEARRAAVDLTGSKDAQYLVSKHAVPVYPKRWSAFKDWLPPLADTNPPVRLSRGDVVAVAADCRVTGDWLPLLVVSFVWGQGDNGYGPSRLSWILHGKQDRAAPDLDDIRRRLAEALRVLHQEGAARAYALLRECGRVPELGPAFFTKFLYFAAKVVEVPGTEAMVLDNVLAECMRWVWARRRNEPGGGDAPPAEWAWRGPRWTTYRYKIYLAFLHRGAAQLSCPERTWTPDLVEMILFCRNPADALGNASATG